VWRGLLLGAVVLLCAVLPYLQTTRYEFVWDDRVLVGPHLDVRGIADVGRLWRTPFDSLLRESAHQRSYFRPVVLYSLAADRALHGDRPAGYHAGNIAWYALAALLLWLFLRDLTGRPLAATAGAILFALHPAHPENVAFVSGRTDLIAGAFLFGALWAAVRWGPSVRPAWRKLLPASLLLLPGLFAKEIALFAAPLPLLALWVVDRRASLRTLAAAAVPLVAATLLYYACRVAVLGAAPLPPVTPVEGTLPQVLTSLWVLARYVALLLVPAGLSAWHEVPHLAAPDAVAIAGLFALAALTAGLAATLRRRSAWSLPLALLAVALLPVCWVRILSGSLVAERLLFLPSAAVAVAVALLPGRRGAGAAAAPPTRPADADAALLGACGAAAVALLLLLAARVPVWRDEGTLYGSMLRAAPESPYVHAALGGYYYRLRDLPRAAYHHRRCYELQPNYTEALLNLGAAQEEMGRVDSAFVSIRELVRRRSDYAAAWYALGNLHVRAGWPDSARAAYETALRLDPRFAQAENNLGVALERMGRPDEALVRYRRATEILPGYREAENNRARLEAERGRKP
jgi:tetratricopeptide (TPR) repeat protein